jgi:periplasmic divalent cation tolerance protein
VMHDADSIVELRTTFGRRDAAEACATRLVAERLAACVQIDGPVSSSYRWQGRVERSEEFRCTCKTTVERAEACAAAMLQQHDYDVPELIRRVVTASSAYAAWVRESVAGG